MCIRDSILHVNIKKKFHINIGPQSFVSELWLAKYFTLISAPLVIFGRTEVLGTQIKGQFI